MYLMYLIALIPVLIGSTLWCFSKKVVWVEWIIGCAIAFLVSGIVHVVTVMSLTGDVETWSGTVHQVTHIPYWHGEWQELETYTVTVGSGKNARTETRTRMVTKTSTHHPEWIVHTNIGEFHVDERKYNDLKKKYGRETSSPGYRPHFDRGDRNDYQLVNQNKWVEPVTDIRSWSNRVKAAKTVFDFPEVPDNAPVFEYPENTNRFSSDRLIGRGAAIDQLEFDRMCSRLGPSKKVNVIIVGFASHLDSSVANLQEAKWLGGKKNDLVICFGGGNGSTATWARCFGWTEEELVKRNLETIFISNKVDKDILPLVEAEIRKNYQIKDWSKFDYIAISPPTSAYIWLLVSMLITQGIFWSIAIFNQFEKENDNNGNPKRVRRNYRR